MQRRSFLNKALLVSVATVYCKLGVSCTFLPTASKSKDLFNSFMKISAYLTDEKNLNQDDGKKYYEYLIKKQENKQLIMDLFVYAKENKKIPADKTDLQKLTQEILTMWYTGIITENGKEKTITYFNSLTWKLLDFTKPQGLCS